MTSGCPRTAQGRLRSSGTPRVPIGSPLRIVPSSRGTLRLRRFGALTQVTSGSLATSVAGAATRFFRCGASPKSAARWVGARGPGCGPDPSMRSRFNQPTRSMPWAVVGSRCVSTDSRGMWSFWGCQKAKGLRSKIAQQWHRVSRTRKISPERICSPYGKFQRATFGLQATMVCSYTELTRSGPLYLVGLRIKSRDFGGAARWMYGPSAKPGQLCTSTARCGNELTRP